MHSSASELRARAQAVNDRLDAMPVTRFHRSVVWKIAAGLFADVFDIFVLAGLASALVKSNWATLEQVAVMATATFAGLTLGAVGAGFVGDKFGRRNVLRVNLALVALATFGAALAPNITVLAALRFLAGLGLGAEAVISYSTLSEFLPARFRERWQGYNAFISTLAVCCAALAGYLILPAFGWRTLLVLAGLCAAAAWIYRFSLPESPRWLAANGRIEEAEALVATMGPAVIAATVGAARPEQTETEAAGLFRGRQLRRTLLAMAINIVLISAGYGVLVWLPSFMVAQGVSISSALEANLVMSLGAPLGTLAGVLAAQTFSRRSAIMVVAIAAAGLSLTYPMVGPAALGAIGLALFACIYALSMLGVSLYVPELFPTAIRLRGAGLASASGRLASTIAPIGVVAAFHRYGLWGAMPALSAMLLGLAAMVWLFGVETKGRQIGRFEA